MLNGKHLPALLLQIICTEILLIRDKCVIQRNNMGHLVVTVQQYEVCRTGNQICVLLVSRRTQMEQQSVFILTG